MLNRGLFNTHLLAAAAPAPVAETAASYDAVEFNGLSLQGDGVVTSELKAWSAPRRELADYSTPRADGGGLTGAYYRERTVRCSGMVTAATAAALEAKMDAMKAALSESEAWLSVKAADGTVRRCRATLANPEGLFAGREGWHVTACPFEAEFSSLDPMWTSIDYESLTQEAVAVLAYPLDFEGSGTYEARPVITLILTAVTAGTGLTVANETTGETLAITATLAAGDCIVVDSEERSVLINGAQADYVGSLPRLAVGSNRFTITAAATAVQYDLTIKAKKTDL